VESNLDNRPKEKLNINRMEKETQLFVIFEIEFVNEKTGQVVSLTTTCGSYRELGKYLTEMSKKSWKMVKVTKKEN
jgi:hypothetical protein